RYLGSTTAQGREHIVFDQQELRRNAGLYSDLFAYDRRGGHVRQLTREARLKDPDLSPDGRMLVCVREGRGSRELVLVPFMGDRTGGRSWPRVSFVIARSTSTSSVLTNPEVRRAS